MTIRSDLVRAFAVALSMACTGIPARLPAQQEIDPGVAELGAGFVSSTADANGTTLHYVQGGTGPAVILLHGFPQDWYEFHQIMPRLAKSFTVVAVDLRGIGGSNRALPASEKFNAAQRSPMDVPLVLAGGDHSFGPLLPNLAEALQTHGWTNVTSSSSKTAGTTWPMSNRLR